MSALLLVGCSNNDNNEVDPIENNETEEDTTENNVSNNDINDAEENNEADNDEVNSDEEDQEDLSFDESGIVVSGQASENFKFEVTPVSIEFIDEYEGEYGVDEALEDVLIKYTAKIENIDNKTIPIQSLKFPTIQPIEDEADENLDNEGAAYEEEITKDGKDISKDDEIEPGEVIEVVSVYDTKETDLYYLKYGLESDQIVTHAHWKIEKKDFK